MKTSITLLLFWCTFSSFYSQDYPCDANSSRCGQLELGVNLFSLQHERNNRLEHLIIPTYATGIILKKHCKNHAWRIGFDRFDYSYFEKSYNDIKPRWWYEATVRTLKHELRLGWEYALLQRKLQPYVALDATLGYKEITLNTIGEGDIMPGVHASESKKSHQYAALSSTLGLRYAFNERISISVESNVGFYYEQVKSPINAKNYSDRSDTFYNVLRSFALHYKF
jgi:hypothetical protein